MATEVTVAVITKSDLNINFTYVATEPQQSTYSYPWNDANRYVHIAIPPTLTLQNIRVVRQEDGTIIIEEDPVRTQLMNEGFWQAVRVRRNLLLSSSDWTQLPDAQLTQEKKQQYQEYRQQLRDLPQVSANPTFITWPTEP